MQTILNDEDNTDCQLTLDLLPNELLYNIFKYLNHYELLKVIPLVCLKWYQISTGPSFWTYISIKQGAPLDYVVAKIEKHHQVNVLKMNSLDCINDVFPSISCSLLTCLDIGFTKINSECIQMNYELLFNLTHLNLERCECICDDDVRIICSSALKLENLNLSHCEQLSTVAMQYIIYLELLAALNVNGVHRIESVEIEKFLNKNVKTIKVLWLDGLYINDACLFPLSNRGHLKELFIHFCENITDETFKYLPAQKEIELLILRKAHQISSHAAVEYFKISESVKNITVLDFTECESITDEVLDEMAKSCTLLQKLSVNWCWFISDIGINRIIDSCGQMRYLSLAGVHKIVGSYFVKIPNLMPKLTYLNVSQCNDVDDNVLRLLDIRMPDLFIIDYYGMSVHDETCVSYSVIYQHFDLYKNCCHI